jgi:hypothetical protein
MVAFVLRAPRLPPLDLLRAAVLVAAQEPDDQPPLAIQATPANPPWPLREGDVAGSMWMEGA